MDPQVSENNNLSPEEIFAADLLSFVLSQYKFSWRWLLYPTNTTQNFFRASIGEAILNCMIQNTANLRRSIILLAPDNGSWNAEFFKDSFLLALRIRPGRTFPMVVTVTSVLCYIGVTQARRGNLRLVDDIVGVIAYVMRVLVGNSDWRWLEAQAEEKNKTVKIPSAA